MLSDDSGGSLGLGRSIESMEADLNLERGTVAADPLVEMERSVERWEGSGEIARRRRERAQQAPASAPEVLIAEDNPDMRALLSMIVGREFRIRVTSNGREALEALGESAPDLVLSDVMMPEMSGIELCKAIKEERRDPGDSGRARDLQGRARDEDRRARTRCRRLRHETLPPARTARARALAGARRGASRRFSPIETKRSSGH